MSYPNPHRKDRTHEPANDGIDVRGKSQIPDPDRTNPVTYTDPIEEAAKPIGEARFNDEHHISQNHAEPIEYTSATNDTYVDSEYIDIGGGD